MGNRFSRRRDIPANGAEAAAPEQKAAEEPAAAQPAEDAGIAQTQEPVKTEDVVVGESAAQVASLPQEEGTSECKEPDAAPEPVNVPEPEPVAKETPAPVEPEPLISLSEPSPPEPEPVVEAQLTPEPIPEPVPEPEPEVEVVPEPVPEPIPESAPAPPEDVEPQTDMLTEESLPEPVISSPALIDLGVPDATPEPINTNPSPADADEPLDMPVTEECQDSAACEPEECEETSEHLEKPTEVEVEAAENLEQLVNDVNVSELLQNLELKGNDLVADLIPNDVKIPDGITDMSPGTELM